jgi:hypothetical protein
MKRASTVISITWLRMHKRCLYRLAKNLRSDLPTGIAINARGIHKEITGDIFGNTLLMVRHGRASDEIFYQGTSV